jgi:glucose-1-phosphate cytidylyltransferase
MQVLILAGGKGTRLAEETAMRPKPMVEIGGKPILWHIMKLYASQGHKEFLIACGYKGELIKEYFANYFIHNSDYFLDLKSGGRQIVSPNGIDWQVGMLDTGLDTMTGGRILRLRAWLRPEAFLVTYGDGLGNIDLNALLDFHRGHGKIATVTAVRPPARFGALELDGDLVREFTEKPQTAAGWINGGFFVFEPAIFDYLAGDETILERETMEQLARDCQLAAYRHEGFWQPMDTLREKHYLDNLWSEGKAPWKVWS